MIPALGYSERLPFDLEASERDHTCPETGEIDMVSVARDRAEHNMHGRSIKGNPLLTPEERKWEAIADRYLFLTGSDDPAYCLAELNELVRTWPTKHTARYLAEVGPKLEARIAERALMKKLGADEARARAARFTTK